MKEGREWFLENAATLNRAAQLILENGGQPTGYELYIPLEVIGKARREEYVNGEVRRGDIWRSDLGLKAEVVYSRFIHDTFFLLPVTPRRKIAPCFSDTVEAGVIIQLCQWPESVGEGT